MDLKPINNALDLAKFPDDWKYCPLGEVGKWFSGGTPSMANVAYWSGDIPWVSAKDMKVSRLHDSMDHISDKAVADGTRLVPVGTVLMVIRGMILAHTFPVARAERPLAFNQDLKAVVTKEGIDSTFLLYWLIGNAEFFLGLTTESTHGTKRLPPETFFRVNFPLPTKTEQEAIAGALNDADGLIESLEELVDKKRRIKQGAMQELLTGKRRLPGFTGEWEVKRFGDLFTMLRNASNSRSELSDSAEVAYIHYGDIHTHPTAFLDATKLSTYIPRDKVSSVPRLADGDLLMADASEDTAAIGKAVEIEGLGDREAVAGLHTMLLRGNRRLLANGFKGYLQFLPAVRVALVRLATGVSVYGITKSGVKAIEVTLPLPAEQSAIAAILSDMDAEIAALEAKLAKVRLVRQGMMQELLTGRIRLVEPVAAAAAPKGHNWAFNEAVVISVLAKGFGSEQFPLGRKRYTKLSYLMHRHHEHQAEGYLKKAAGPYNPATKYKGPEAIAIKNGYARQHSRDKFSGFVAADKIAEADSYFRKWYGNDVLTWLEQFRYKPNDELELLATVDMAMEDLRHARKSVELSTVKLVIRNHPEWEAKLDRDIFSDTNIARAIKLCGELFAHQG